MVTVTHSVLLVIMCVDCLHVDIIVGIQMTLLLLMIPQTGDDYKLLMMGSM